MLASLGGSILRLHTVTTCRCSAARLNGHQPGDEPRAGLEEVINVKGSVLTSSQGEGGLHSPYCLWCVRAPAGSVGPSRPVWPLGTRRSCQTVTGSRQGGGLAGTTFVLSASTTATPRLVPRGRPFDHHDESRTMQSVPDNTAMRAKMSPQCLAAEYLAPFHIQQLIIFRMNCPLFHES